MGMGDFWMGIAPAQNAVAGTKRADGRHRILSIVGGIAIAKFSPIAAGATT